MPGLAQLPDQFADPGEGGFERGEIGELAADMDGDAGDREPGKRARPIISGARAIDRHAELVVRRAGRDLCVGARVDVRVHAERDRCLTAETDGDGRQHLRLLDRFEVEQGKAAGERFLHFRLGLADAGKDDLRGCDPRSDGAAIFADRDDVRAEPLGGERREHGGIGIGLDREGRQRLAGRRDGRLEHAGVAAHRRGRIDIDRRADRLGDGRQRHVLAVEDALPDLEMVHVDPVLRCSRDG